MKPANRYDRRIAKHLTRTEKAVIFCLIVLAGANASLGLTDRFSLDAVRENLTNAPLSFALPLVCLASSVTLGLICFKMESSVFQKVLSYLAIAPFVFGMIELSKLITL